MKKNVEKEVSVLRQKPLVWAESICLVNGHGLMLNFGRKKHQRSTKYLDSFRTDDDDEDRLKTVTEPIPSGWKIFLKFNGFL